jgi:hypothetical protein
MVKIIDKVNEKVAEGKPFFSFEYFPPRTEEVSRRPQIPPPSDEPPIGRDHP